MNKSVKISVIMSVFNPASLENLRLAVDSILSQSLTDFEFLILDDGSGFKTHRALEELAGKDGRIRLIFQKENRPFRRNFSTVIRSTILWDAVLKSWMKAGAGGAGMCPGGRGKRIFCHTLPIFIPR